MSFAAQSMSLNGRYGARSYAWLRQEAAAYLSVTRKGEGNPMFGRTPSKESTERRVASMRANRGDKPGPLKGRRYSAEAKAARKPAPRGSDNPFFGRRHTSESRKRMSEALKGRASHQKGKPLSEKQRRRLSEINTGRKHSDEAKERISLGLKGRPKPPRSAEHQRNLAEANRRNGEIMRARNAEKPIISNAMRQAFSALNEEDGLSCSDIFDRSNLSMSSIGDALKKMDVLRWVSVAWKRPATKKTGRMPGKSKRRFYSLTAAGLLAFFEANNGPSRANAPHDEGRGQLLSRK